MKRNQMLNKIISLVMIFAMYLTMSASAFAEIDNPETDYESVETIKDDDSTLDAEESTGEVIIVEDSEEIVADDQIPEDLPIEPVDEETEDEEVEDEEVEDEEVEDEETEDEETEEELEELEEECEHEFDEDGKCIKCGFEKLPDPVLTYEDSDVIINVAGAVPENADLRVTPITAENDETKDAFMETAGKLQKKYESKEADVIGFLAYDISFVLIETGETVEPDGDVTVSMEYKHEVNPVSERALEKAETVDVAMMHIDGTTNELEDLTEAGKAVVCTGNDSNVTAASFTNDSFSTYIITWSGVSNKKITVNFISKSSKGETISDLNHSTSYEVTENSGEQLLADVVDAISGFRFEKAIINDSGVAKEITKWKFREEVEDYLLWLDYDQYLDLYNGDTFVKEVEFSSTKTLDVTVYYVENINLTIKNVATGDATKDTNAEYVYVIKDSNGTALTSSAYKVGDASFTTDATTGEFKLKHSDVAEFRELPAGTYTITELRVDTSEYDLVETFTTRIFVNDSETPTEYAAGSDATREIQVNVADNTPCNVKFQNCITTTQIIEKQGSVVEKFVEDLKDDKYSLTLKFKGPYETVQTTINEIEQYEQINKLYLDIILVIDKSGSMNYSGTPGKTRIQNVKAAVDSMIDVIAEKEDVNAKWKVIDFANKAKVVSNGWVDTSNIKRYVTTTLGASGANGIGTGTNYQAGLELAQTEMSSRPIDEANRPNAQRIVIFLTDGEPTYYTVGDGVSGQGSHITEEAETAAYNATAALQTDHFYAIGIGLGTMQYYKKRGNSYVATDDYINGSTLLENMIAKSPATTKAAYNIAISDVTTIFKDLAGTISSIQIGDSVVDEQKYFASNATMIDTLSDNVVITKESIFYINVAKDGTSLTEDASKWVDGVIDENGIMTTPAKYILPDGKELTATYQDGVVTLNFPAGHILDQKYEYSVKLYVEPSEAAYDYYFENKTYPDEGDEGTDHFRNEEIISSEMPGFYTNGPAYVNYTFKDEAVTDNFPKPVIPVHIINVWELYKLDAKTGAGLNGALFSLTQIETEETPLSYTGESKTTEDKAGIVTWSDEVAAGATYKLMETKAPDTYVLSTDVMTITISDENVPTATLSDAAGDQMEVNIQCTRVGRIVTYRLDFTNEKIKIQLPYAGGSGTRNFTIFGILLMLGSVGLFFLLKKKIVKSED
jgi:LPXTG-motif cell wall-anchored protein